VPSRLNLTPRRIAVIAVILIGVLLYFLTGRTSKPKLSTAPVTRGPIVRAVSSSGTLNPVVTVQVGSYVSGTISAIYADFNASVRQGQLIAKIDPRPFQVKVAEAQAALSNAKAQLGKDSADLSYKKLSYHRNRTLAASGAVSRDAVDSARNAYKQSEAQVELDKANIQQQEASLQEATVNLNYTDIVSPVDGTVVSRNVDVGQTVAASFQTPTLFLIAKDLTQMQVDANVSESDVGQTKVGQTANFHVDAYPDREFQGQVAQVRQAPITVQNVVTYDVVVSVGNPELLLKPGMTANLTILTDKRDDVVRVPLQAIRFRPDGQRQDQRQGQGGGQRAQGAGGGGHWQGGGNRQLRSAGPGRHSRVYVATDGSMKPVPIVPGLDDGTNVEVVQGDVHPGDQVVVDRIDPAADTKTRTQSGSGPPRFRF